MEDRYLEYLDWRGIEANDACKRCGGSGYCAYGNTSTWRHGIGGQAITTDICEICWGSGSESRHWPSWRERQTSDQTTGVYKVVLEDISREEWSGPMGEIRLKRVIDKACSVLNHPSEACSIQAHRSKR